MAAGATVGAVNWLAGASDVWGSAVTRCDG